MLASSLSVYTEHCALCVSRYISVAACLPTLATAPSGRGPFVRVEALVK